MVQYLKAFPRALRPVHLSKEAEVPAVAGEGDGEGEEGEGRTVVTPGTNQQ